MIYTIVPIETHTLKVQTVEKQAEDRVLISVSSRAPARGYDEPETLP